MSHSTQPVEKSAQIPTKQETPPQESHSSSEAYERLNRIAPRIIARQEDENHRIASKLHDDIGQLLTALRLNLALLESQAVVHSNEREQQFKSATVLVESIMDDLRALSYHLHPPAVDAVGLNKALFDFCRRASVENDLSIQYTGMSEDYSPNYIQVIVYKLAQKVLREIIGLGNVRHIVVRLEQDVEMVSLNIQVNEDSSQICGLPFLPAFQKQSCQDLQDEIEVLGGHVLLEADDRSLRLSTRIPYQVVL